MPAPLSADRIAAGVQCELRLWKQLREPPGRREAGASDSDELERLRAGLRSLYPDALDASGADSAVPFLEGGPGGGPPAPVLGARLQVAGVDLRIDLLERGGDGRLELGLVGDEARVREPLIDRAALQLHAVEAAGFEVGAVRALLPDPGYVRGAEPDWPKLLRRVDVTREARLIAGDVPGDLERAARVAAAAEPPAVEPSPHCRRPRACEFLAECTAGRDPGWIGWLPGLKERQHRALRERGVERIVELEDSEARTPAQRNARRALERGAVWAGAGLGRRLSGFGPPAHFLDFEAVAPAEPVFAGTRPLEAVPFLWSLHRLDAAGELRHRDWIGPPGRDPRPELARSLLDALGESDGPIVVWSGFEAEAIAGLERALPERAGELRRVAGRLRDLLPAVRENVYAPGFYGSFSLKRVAPALAPGFDYAGLELADGGAAAREFLRLARAETPPDDQRARLEALRAYCARDTLALVELLRALRRLAASEPPVS